MKRSVLIVSALLAALTISSQARAVTLSVGVNLWYNWWHPAWSSRTDELTFDAPNPLPPPFRLNGFQFADSPDVRASSAFAYGPALSARIGPVSVSTVFMYAYYDFSSQGTAVLRNYFVSIPGLATISAQYGSTTINVKRWDSDTTMSYTLTPVFSLLLGLKIQNYGIDFRTIAIDSTLMTFTSSFFTAGPGIGIGITYPLVGDVYLIWNNTFFVLWSRQSAETVLVSNGTITNFDDGKYLNLGGTSTLSLAYVFSPIRTTLALGVRYQVLWYRTQDDRTGILNVDRSFDHYYAVTFSAIYTFDLSRGD